MSSSATPAKINFYWVRATWRTITGAIEFTPGALRILIVVGSAVAFPAYPLPFVAALWLLVIWLAPRVFQPRHELKQPEPRPDPVTEAHAEYLQIKLAKAHQQITRLEQELETAKQAARYSMSEESETRGHPVFRRVGLDQDCPKWLAEIVRREFRRRLHPDGKGPTQKAEAERRFKQAEEVFSEIWQLRGF
jgi:hypothetical protein